MFDRILNTRLLFMAELVDDGHYVESVLLVLIQEIFYVIGFYDCVLLVLNKSIT